MTQTHSLASFRSATQTEQRRLYGVIESLFDQNFDVVRIGQQLGIPTDVVRAITKYGKLEPSIRYFTERETQEILSLGTSHVHECVRRGWLAVYAKGRGRAVRSVDDPSFKHSTWAVAETSLEAFLDNPETWMLWNPESIHHPALQQYAAYTRAQQPVRWLTTRQAAEQLGVSINAIRHAIGDKRLRSVQIIRMHWIREDWLPVSIRPLKKITLAPHSIQLEELVLLEECIAAGMTAPQMTTWIPRSASTLAVWRTRIVEQQRLLG